MQPWLQADYFSKGSGYSKARLGALKEADPDIGTVLKGNGGAMQLYLTEHNFCLCAGQSEGVGPELSPTDYCIQIQ